MVRCWQPRRLSGTGDADFKRRSPAKDTTPSGETADRPGAARRPSCAGTAAKEVRRRAAVGAKLVDSVQITSSPTLVQPTSCSTIPGLERHKAQAGDPRRGRWELFIQKRELATPSAS